MSERAPYSRVYWTVRNDPRLAGIYSDDHHWAAWNRLLLAADMAWPAPADLPVNVRRASLGALEAAGVIELLPGGLFCFHGLDSERGHRREAAAASAIRRWSGDQPHTARIPNASQPQTERNASRAEPRQDETTRAMREENGRRPVLIDEQNWTLEQRQAAYVAAQSRRTGVKP